MNYDSFFPPPGGCPMTPGRGFASQDLWGPASELSSKRDDSKVKGEPGKPSKPEAQLNVYPHKPNSQNRAFYQEFVKKASVSAPGVLSIVFPGLLKIHFVPSRKGNRKSWLHVGDHLRDLAQELDVAGVTSLMKTNGETNGDKAKKNCKRVDAAVDKGKPRDRANEASTMAQQELKTKVSQLQLSHACLVKQYFDLEKRTEVAPARLEASINILKERVARLDSSVKLQRDQICLLETNRSGVHSPLAHSIERKLPGWYKPEFRAACREFSAPSLFATDSSNPYNLSTVYQGPPTVSDFMSHQGIASANPCAVPSMHYAHVCNVQNHPEGMRQGKEKEKKKEQKQGQTTNSNSSSDPSSNTPIPFSDTYREGVYGNYRDNYDNFPSSCSSLVRLSSLKNELVNLSHSIGHRLCKLEAAMLREKTDKMTEGNKDPVNDVKDSEQGGHKEEGSNGDNDWDKIAKCYHWEVAPEDCEATETYDFEEFSEVPDAAPKADDCGQVSEGEWRDGPEEELDDDIDDCDYDNNDCDYDDDDCDCDGCDNDENDDVDHDSQSDDHVIVEELEMDTCPSQTPYRIE